MNEFLIVRLSSNKASPVQWLAWSEQQNEVIASGEIPNWDAMAELANYAQLRSVILLISSQDVINHNVEVPPGGARQFEHMLPYLLEDELAQDVDELHFAVIGKQAGEATVCAVEKRWFHDCLTYLSSCGLAVKQVMPDAFALPTVEGISAVEIADHWLMKKSPQQAIGVDASWLPIIASSDWVKDGDEYLPLYAYSPLPEMALNEGQEWQNVEPVLVMQLLAQGAIASKVNLLTGEFKPKSSLGRYWKIWQKTAIAAGVLLLVSLGNNWLQLRNYQAQADQYRDESERIFRSVSGKNRIPTVSYLKREMESQVNLLSGGGSQTDTVLNWWMKLPEALKTVKDLSIISIKYDSGRQEVQMEAKSKDFETFEKAREALSNQFLVEQGQLNRSGTLVNGTFVLKQHTGANG